MTYSRRRILAAFGAALLTGCGINRNSSTVDFSLPMDFDYKDHIRFDAPLDMIGHVPELVLHESQFRVDGDLKKKIEQTLKEVSQTPEGQGLLRGAIENTHDGNIYLVQRVAAEAASTQTYVDSIFRSSRHYNLICFNLSESDSKYPVQGLNLYQDLSVQRTLVHELAHYALGHLDTLAGDNVRMQERDVIEFTNMFMAKYYGEIPRDPDYSRPSMDGGTPEWDINPRFNP